MSRRRSRVVSTVDSRSVSLSILFWTFLKIGSTAFGGFMALISVVQNIIVERKKLLTHEDMLDGISLATILPGPVAVNVVAYTGYRLRGGLGAAVSAFAVILPSFLLLLVLSYAYFRWGQIPAVNKFFMGFIPAVSAIIFAAAWNMGSKTLKGAPEWLLAAFAFFLLLKIGGFFITLAIILAAGVIGWLEFYGNESSVAASKIKTKSKGKPAKPSARRRNKRRRRGRRLHGFAVLPVAAGVAPLLGINIGLAGKLLATFAGMSVLLFGGGFVFIPLIQESVVDGYGWVTQQEFVDAIAMGQVTPGPILISATFIGFKVAGLLGATAATLGIFTPPALLMLFSAHFLERIKTSPLIKAALRGIRSAIIGMIAAAGIVVATTAQPNWISILIFCAAMFAILRLRLEVVWIIPTAGLSGMLLY